MSAATTQVITEDLRRWIIAQAEAGCRPEDVIASMRASGWDEDVAMEAMEQTLRERLDEITAGRESKESLPEPVPVPTPDYDDGCSALLVAGGREVKVLLLMKHPRVMLFGGFLSDDECDALAALAGPRLARSETVDNATGGSEVNVARTSDGMFFARGETPLVSSIEARIAELVRWPVENGEGMQVLRYRPGAEYKPHQDYFDPAHPGTARILERGGQRVGTLVMYLNTPAGGGATTFPDVGLSVAPVKGNAVFFAYERAHVSSKVLHGGAPVTAGEKWVATKWLRERVFT